MNTSYPPGDGGLIDAERLRRSLLGAEMLDESLVDVVHLPSSTYEISHSIDHEISHLQCNEQTHINAGMELKDRMKAARKHAKLTQAQLATKAKVDQAVISNLERGVADSSKKLSLIARACGVDRDWLETGKGFMEPGAGVGAGLIGVAEPTAAYESGSPASKDYALIPQYDARMSGGNGCLNDHVEIKGGLAFKRDWLARLGARPESLVVVYLEGPSMEPTILDGEVVLVDLSQKEPMNNKIYALLRPGPDGGVSAKRLIKKTIGDGWTVRSDNPDKTRYPDEDASPETLNEIPFIGRVIWRGGGL